nr:predicted protein [Triticum aestivum]
MSAAESLGSHQLNSFAAFLEERLHTSSETSVVNPQLKKMADGKKPRKGGKRPEVNTSFEIPEDIYAGYCTPDEAKFGKEDKNQRKKFALNPPCSRPPLRPGQLADPTSLKRGEDYATEWARRQDKLAKQAKEAVRKFNEDSAAAANTAEASGSKPRKAMPKKPTHKSSASPSMPSCPSSSAMPSRPASSKPSRQIPQSAPPPPTKSSAPPTKSSAPVHLATFQRTQGFSIASGASASSSAARPSSVGPSLLKKKATAGRGIRPSPHKKQVTFQVPSDDDEADDYELDEIIRDRQARAARAKGSNVPLLLDPKLILDFIDLWHKDAATPLPEMNLTPAETKQLSDDFNRYHADWKGAKVQFVNLMKTFSSTASAPVHVEIPQAEESAQPIEEHASIADVSMAAEETESTRADDSIPAAEDIARASNAPEEREEARATAIVVPEENAPPVPTPTPILPSALDVKKTKAAECAAMKKRKPSASSNSSAPKKMKTLIKYEIPEESDEETPSAASTEQLDKEIEVDEIPSTPVISSPVPQFTAEEAGVEELEDEDVDIGCTTPVLNDDSWENTPQPKPKNPFSKKPKFKADDFFCEHVYFTEFNPYDNARLRRKRFWTASQANFYSSVLFDKDKVFDHEHIPHVDMESMPCFTPVLSDAAEPGQAQRTKFLVKDLLYVPRTIYRILTKTISPIKGHDSSDEEIVGMMKNMLFNIMHGIPINYHDFFMRTLANFALSPFELKPYASWIMRFLETRSSLNYKADFQNHLSYLPLIEVLKRTISSSDKKGKSPDVIDEGIRPLDGQFRKAASYSTNDDSATHDSAANAPKSSPQATSPRVTTDRELLISLHQKVDRNHKWVKRQFGSILDNMTSTHNAVKKNHYYLHEVFDRTLAILSHLYGEDLKQMGFKEDIEWSAPPPKKFKKVKVPSLVASSYSSSRAMDENEDLDDTAAGPTTTQDPDNAGAPPSS